MLYYGIVCDAITHIILYNIRLYSILVQVMLCYVIFRGLPGKDELRAHTNTSNNNNDSTTTTTTTNNNNDNDNNNNATTNNTTTNNDDSLSLRTARKG